MSEQSIKKQLQDAVKASMRAKEKDRLIVLRMILAEFKQVEIDRRIELDHTEELTILDMMEKQRKDSMMQFEQANRPELVEKELYEIGVIKEFKPPAMTDAEVKAEIDSAIAEVGASSIKDMGKVMAILKPKLQGRADMGVVSKKIKSQLA
tara:strand:+ start:24368 stop:24820 length:453 start_codon:yes stop_codon:yes gene_type:complete